jgi:hypothetical protein
MLKVTDGILMKQNTTLSMKKNRHGSQKNILANTQNQIHQM